MILLMLLAEFTTLKGANFKRDIYSLTGRSGFITMVSDKTKNLCGGDWCLVVPLVFKASVGLIRSRVGSIPIRLRHLFRAG
jgi:hypothetical protein